MAEERGHLSLNDGQKSRLLGFALAADQPAAPPDGDEQRGDLLCDLLRCPLPIPEVACAGGAPAANSSHGGLRSVFGPSIRDLLLDPKTDVAVLRRLKDYAKTLGRNAGSDIEKDVFLAIYCAAIVGAMVFHNERITEHSDFDLTQFLDSFAHAAWIPMDLAYLFAKAVHWCGQKATTAKHPTG